MSRQGPRLRDLLFAGTAALAVAIPLARVAAQDAAERHADKREALEPTSPAVGAPDSHPPVADPPGSPAVSADAAGSPPPDAPESTAATESTASSEPAVIANEDVVDMTKAGFAESTILAAIAANDSHFDVSPHALMALKEDGVSQPVIQAMLNVEAANKKAASIAQKAAADNADAPPPAEIVRLSKMIEQLAAKQDAAAAAQRTPEPPKNADPRRTRGC